MIRSMTGFGRGEAVRNNRTITIEMKSVNHRYCDINIRMPKVLFHIENKLKNIIKQEISRGKIDVFINYEDRSDKANSIVYNSNLTQQYMERFQEISQEFHIENDIKVSHLTRYPEVLVLEDQEQDDEEILESLAEESLRMALMNVKETRSKEGQMLKTDLKTKLEDMLGYVDELKAITPKVIDEYRIKLTERISELTDQALVDPERIAMEVALYADKSCIDEEIVRLESHIVHMRDTLDADEAIGRKLDFISQEMNREANTVLSKANNIEVSNQGIELKTLIEKVREQIQNIE
jgi:uncharacterized protein (TIGR00255 family)